MNEGPLSLEKMNTLKAYDNFNLEIQGNGMKNQMSEGSRPSYVKNQD